MDYTEALELFTEVLGPPTWTGAESDVWRQGNHVVKLACVSRDVLAMQRRLQRSPGSPIAKIHDIRVLGKERVGRNPFGAIVVMLVQEYIPPNEVHWALPSSFLPGDLHGTAPEKWQLNDGTHVRQVDGHAWNKIKGKWIDTLSVFTYRSGANEAQEALQ